MLFSILCKLYEYGDVHGMKMLSFFNNLYIPKFMQKALSIF